MQFFNRDRSKKRQNVQSCRCPKKSGKRKKTCSRILKSSPQALCNPSFGEDSQELTITDFFPRLTLAPVPEIPSLPNSSINLFPHVFTFISRIFSSSSFPFYFFSAFKLHQKKRLVCSAVPSSYRLTSRIFIAEILKQVVSMCYCHLCFIQPPFSI